MYYLSHAIEVEWQTKTSHCSIPQPQPSRYETTQVRHLEKENILQYYTQLHGLYDALPYLPTNVKQYV